MSKLTERIERALAQPKVSTVCFSMDDLAELSENPADYGGEGVAYLTPEKAKELLSNAKNPRVAKRKGPKVRDEDNPRDGETTTGGA